LAGILGLCSELLSFLCGRTRRLHAKTTFRCDCAFDWFFFPWICVHWHSMASFLTDAPIENVSMAISGWINPVFFLAVILQVIGKTPRLSKVLRYVTLLMLPFSWVLFLDQHVYPREGYFPWIGAMLLVLFNRARKPAIPDGISVALKICSQIFMPLPCPPF